MFVTVYGVSPNSDNENPRKSYKRVKEKPEFKTTTPLGKLAHQTLNVESKYRDKEDPPIFMEMAVEGVDTFTKKEGLGFYERGQDKFEQRDGEPHVVRGERTG
ncbi:hypothetical protein, partial [Salmonella enterica]|uniref:hypothetical protein n=1 Tax=Salmonella enterica TaxID=28901 RepID=UPI001BB0D0FE